MISPRSYSTIFLEIPAESRNVCVLKGSVVLPTGDTITAPGRDRVFTTAQTVPVAGIRMLGHAVHPPLCAARRMRNDDEQGFPGRLFIVEGIDGSAKPSCAIRSSLEPLLLPA